MHSLFRVSRLVIGAILVAGLAGCGGGGGGSAPAHTAPHSYAVTPTSPNYWVESLADNDTMLAIDPSNQASLLQPNGTATLLAPPTSSGPFFASGMSRGGQFVIGEIGAAFSGEGMLYDTSTNTWTDLGEDSPEAVNNKGDVVAIDGSGNTLLIRHGGSTTTLMANPSLTWFVSGINDSDQIVGTEMPAESGPVMGPNSIRALVMAKVREHAQLRSRSLRAHVLLQPHGGISDGTTCFVWDGTTKQTIPAGQFASVFAINNAGEVVGVQFPPSGDTASFTWRLGAQSVTQLQPLSGDTDSFAMDINAWGDVVGSSENIQTGSSKGVIWPNGSVTPTDLSTLCHLTPGTIQDSFNITSSDAVLAEEVSGTVLLTPQQ